MDLSHKIKSILDTLPKSVKLIAVTKTKPTELIMDAYQAGLRIFGENKAQELFVKFNPLPKDIQWHMIGHLQSNKVKYIAPFVDLIHSVDGMDLLQTINREGHKNNRIINCLLQLKIAKEQTKFGLSEADLFKILDSIDSSQLFNIRIKGLMGMATFTEDVTTVREEFRYCKRIFDEVRSHFGSRFLDFNELSMGMSDDYLIAVEEGSTMVRIGSSIFGVR
jgi:PLP dependent protein